MYSGTSEQQSSWGAGGRYILALVETLTLLRSLIWLLFGVPLFGYFTVQIRHTQIHTLWSLTNAGSSITVQLHASQARAVERTIRVDARAIDARIGHALILVWKKKKRQRTHRNEQ